MTTSNYFDYYVISVVLEPIKEEFQVSDTMLGLLSGFCFSLVYGIAGLPIARWADRGNRRTIITIAVTGWSVMTAACGLAHSFLQLALARFALGIVEPGALPPAHSLIADYFPPERRATAVSVLNSGSAAGWLAGVGLGGYIVATQGWRSSFFLAGASGLVLALIVRCCLAEPRLPNTVTSAASEVESLGTTVIRLWEKRSFLFVLAAMSVYGVFNFGVTIFIPSFLIRALHLTLEQVSGTWGVAIAVANIFGAFVGGWLGDRLSRKDLRWYAWMPAIACALSVPLYWLAFSAHQLWSFIALDMLAEGTLAVGLFTSFAAVHAVCGNARRAMSIAIVILACSLFGGGFGPLLTGALSDYFHTSYGSESLRYSMLIMLIFLAPAAIAFFYAGRVMPDEIEL